MSIGTDILGVAASAASGGLFGLLGTVTGRVATYFEKRQDMAFEKEKWAHELALQELQAKARAAETEREIAVAGVQGSWNGLTASIDADAKADGGYRWVAAVRGLTRPVLTIGLMAFLGARWFTMTPGDESQYITESITFASVTAIVWWFGDRAPQMARKRA